MPNQPLPVDSPWFTPNQAAAHLAVSARTLYRLIEQGKLPAHRVGTRIVRIHRDDLDAVMGRASA